MGYLLGAFSQPKWKTYMLCAPAAVLLVIAIRIVIPSAQENPELPGDVMLLAESVLNTLLAALGMYLAHRKSKTGYES